MFFKKNQPKNEDYASPIYHNIYIGLLVAMGHLIITSFSNFAQKMIAKDHVDGNDQNYYLAFTNAIPSFVIMCLQRNFGLSSPKYILFCLSNGPVFYLANFFAAEALKYISITKYIPISYLTIVFVFILGFLVFGEHIYFTDVLGSCLIMGFQVYNISVPTSS